MVFYLFLWNLYFIYLIIFGRTLEFLLGMNKKDKYILEIKLISIVI